MSAPVSEDLRVLTPRGALSKLLLDPLPGEPDRTDLGVLASSVRVAVSSSEDSLVDDDIQLSLFVLYGLHCGSIPRVGGGWEWQPDLIAARRILARGSVTAYSDGPLIVRGEVDIRDEHGSSIRRTRPDGRAVPVRRVSDQALVRQHPQARRFHTRGPADAYD